jgi:hypothetical protein
MMDPVRACDLYKNIGCTHVDGFLCDYPDCSMLKEYKMNEKYTCWCHKCNKDRKVHGIPYSMTRMILCPKCGNKRCPHASDCDLECTDSNDPGQPGSVY